MCRLKLIELPNNMRKLVTYLLIFLMMVLSPLKSGRSVGSSDQHLIMMLFTSSYEDSSTFGRKGASNIPGPSLTSLIISAIDT